MQTQQQSDYQNQIEEALKRATYKKVYYIYDDAGNKHLLGIFNKKKALEIKKYLRKKGLWNRVSESDVLTTEPDTLFRY